jgi:small ubiquitin-related modifier
MSESTGKAPTTTNTQNTCNEETQELFPTIQKSEIFQPEKTGSYQMTVILRNQSNQTMQFKVRKSTEFKKIFSAYAARVGVPTGELRFLLDGEAISENQTPDLMSLEEGDQIEVFQFQVGGAQEDEAETTDKRDLNEQPKEEKESLHETPASVSAFSAPTVSPAVDKPLRNVVASHSMNLRIKDQTNGQIIFFKIKQDILLSKVFEYFAKQRGYSLSLIRFYYDGKRLQGNVTPKMLKMKDGDEIDATVEQTGGK